WVVVPGGCWVLVPIRTGPARGKSRRRRLGWRPGPSSGSHESRDHLVGLVGEGLLGLGEVALPRLGVPQLEPVAGTDDGAVLGEAGVLAQRRGDGHPALLVGDLVGGAGEEDAHVVAG